MNERRWALGRSGGGEGFFRGEARKKKTGFAIGGGGGNTGTRNWGAEKNHALTCRSGSEGSSPGPNVTEDIFGGQWCQRSQVRLSIYTRRG